MIPASAIDVTALICTRNCASRLQDVLAAATPLRIPSGLQWELWSSTTAPPTLRPKDDVPLDTEWLAAYATALARRPDAIVFSGRIIPLLEFPSRR